MKKPVEPSLLSPRASDFLFDAVNTRSIHADVRYMLRVMSEVDGASHLVEEMGIAP